MRRTLGNSVAYFERDRLASVDVVRAMEIPDTFDVQAVSIPWG